MLTFAARLTDQYGDEFNGTVTWTSEDPDVFSVDAAGRATAAGNGAAMVRASFQQLSATAQVTVRQVVAAIAVTPALDSLFAIGDTARFNAEATDANGYAVADAVVAWESSAPRVATVDAHGLVTAVGDGDARITATSGGVTASALVVTSAGVIRIAVASLDTTVVVPIEAAGQSWTYTVTESRWLPEMPVAGVSRRATPPGVVVEVQGPGWVQINPTIAGTRVRGIRVEVAPPRPFVECLNTTSRSSTGRGSTSNRGRPIRIGEGQAAGGQSASGGNYYFLVTNSRGVHGSVQLEVTDGDAHMEWKLVRYR